MLDTPDTVNKLVSRNYIHTVGEGGPLPRGAVGGAEEAICLLKSFLDGWSTQGRWVEDALRDPDWRFDLAGWDVPNGWFRETLFNINQHSGRIDGGFHGPNGGADLLHRGPPLTAEQANQLVRFADPDLVRRCADLLPEGSLNFASILSRHADVTHRLAPEDREELVRSIPTAAWKDRSLVIEDMLGRLAGGAPLPCRECPTEYQLIGGDREDNGDDPEFGRHAERTGIAQRAAALRVSPLHGLPPTFVPANTYAARSRIARNWRRWGFANQVYLVPREPRSHREVLRGPWDVGFDRRTDMVYLCSRRVVVFDFDDSRMDRADSLRHCEELARRTGLNLDLWETDRGVHAVVLNRTVRNDEQHWVRLLASTACDPDYAAFASVRGWAVRLTRKEPTDFVSRHLRTIRVRDDEDEVDVLIFTRFRKELTELFTGEADADVAALLRGESKPALSARVVALYERIKGEELRAAAARFEVGAMPEPRKRKRPRRFDVPVGGFARRGGQRFVLSRYGEWEEV